jgi:import inner membrane translocase subunit TIM50
MGFPDVRTVLSSFSGTHIPTEYARREALARQKFNAQLASEKAKRPKRSAGSLLGSALGVPKGGLQQGQMVDPLMSETFGEGYEKGKMLMDQVRERGQKQYELLEREIRENGAKWLKEMEVEEEKAKEEAMRGMKEGVFGWFGGGKGGKKEEGGKPAETAGA